MEQTNSEETALPPDEGAAANRLARVTLQAARAAIVFQIGLSAILLLTLAQSDKLIFERGFTIRLAFVGTELDLQLFLIAGPIAILLSWLYLQSIRRQLHRYRAAGILPGYRHSAGLLPNLLSGRIPEVVHFVIFPGTLFVFAFKADFRADANLWFAASGAAVVMLFGSLVWDYWARRSWAHRILLTGRYAVLGGVAAFLFLAPSQATRLVPLNLVQADLSNRNLVGVSFVRANLRGANLAGATLSDSDLRHADLTGADLTGTNLTGAKLDDTILRDANLSLTELSGASLARSNLARADLTGANLARAKLFGANLTGARLVETNARATDLAGANLSRAEVVQADFTDANLRRTQFGNARVLDSTLHGVQLVGANLHAADLSGSALAQANVTGADLKEAVITEDQLQQACVSEEQDADAIQAKLALCN